MSQTASLIAELKRALREDGHTYRDLAAHLGVSEPTVKRMFSRQNFTLERLEQALAFVGLDFSELMERVNRRRDFLSKLTLEQEDALVGDPEVFVITFLVLNHWRVDQIVERYDFNEQQVERVLLKLNRLKLIELLPLNRYRLLTARNFAWRPRGSVHRFFRERVLPEFHASDFSGEGERLRFLGGMLSPQNMAEMQDGIERLAARFADLSDQDARLPLSERSGCGAVLAFRPVEFAMFRERRRAPA
ncbi:MAG: helix-turn-helix transcriptional regulator [Pseudomonadota bacterium]